MNTLRTALVSALLALPVGQAAAATYQIGDNDGYGAGICDNCTHSFNGSTANYDGRSLAEQAATNGAEYTDTYSTTHPGYGPQAGTVATFSFLGLGSGWTAAHLEIDAADFQAQEFGAVLTKFNGITQAFGFQDGFPNTAIHAFNLDAAVITSINNMGQLIITIDRNGSGDFYGFDYLKLSDTSVGVVPEPETYAMLLAGLGLLGFVARRRQRKLAAA